MVDERRSRGGVTEQSRSEKFFVSEAVYSSSKKVPRFRNRERTERPARRSLPRAAKCSRSVKRVDVLIFCLRKTNVSHFLTSWKSILFPWSDRRFDRQARRHYLRRDLPSQYFTARITVKNTKTEAQHYVRALCGRIWWR